MPPLLLLQDIALTFGVAPVLSGAGLAVATGDRICLVGRNGSGKSTLLRIAAGLVQAMPANASLNLGRRFNTCRRNPIWPASPRPLPMSRPGLTLQRRTPVTGRCIC